MSYYSNINIRFGADISEFSTAIQNASRQMQRAGSQLQSVGKSLTYGLTLPIVGLGAAALQTFGEIDALKRGLTAVMGEAADTEAEFIKLREVAKLPGLGLEEAVRGSVNLQAIGLNADEARKAMSAFGNAIATIGGGKENFDLAIRGFSQLTNAAKPLQQDLYQIANQLPQVNRLMIDTFGSNRAEDLAAMGMSGKQLANFLVTELGKLPPVAGGIKNAFENMGDSIKISLAKVGESLEKNFNISGKIEALASWLLNLADAFNNLSPFAQKMIISIAGIVAVTGPLLLGLGAIVKIVPLVVAGFGAISAAAPYLLVISGIITAIASGMNLFGNNTKKAASSTDLLNKSITTEVTEADKLFGKLKLTNSTNAERSRLISEINSKYGTHLKNINDETKFLTQVEGAYTGIIGKIKQKLTLEANSKKLTESIQKQIELEDKYTSALLKSKTTKDEIDKANSEGTTMGEISQSQSVKYTNEALGLQKLITQEIKKQDDLLKQGAQVIKPISASTDPSFNATIGGKSDKKEKKKYDVKIAEGDTQLADNTRKAAEMMMDSQDLQISKEIKVNLEGDIHTEGLKNSINKSFEDVNVSINADAAELNKAISSTMSDGISGTINSSFAAIGENIAMNEDPFKDVGNILLDSMGKLMSVIGGLMITWGIAQLNFESSLATLNPIGMIAAGAVMVAAGAGISAYAKKGLKGGSSGGEGSSSVPSSSYGNQNLTLHTRVDGNDLVLATDRTSYIIRR